MGESPKLSLTFRVDSGVLEHNNRIFKAKNVDADRTSDNITYKSENLEEKYHEIFDAALDKYNSKKRSNEKIHDYYEHIRKGKQEKPFYEVVVQFGDISSCGLKSGNWETAKQMLDEYMRSFEERNKNMKVFNAVMHLDEATPHLHIDFVPICTNQSRGLSTRVSLKRALAEQGISANSRKKLEWAVWKDVEFECMTKILRKHGFDRDIKNAHYEHLTVDEYKQVAATAEKIREINAHLNELKKKNSAEYTAEDAELIKNQNDFLRSEIQKRDERIYSLSRKIGAKFVPLDIYSEDKLQFVSAELEKAGVPFVEENNTLHIPDYAHKTAAAIAESFRPKNAENIREKIKLDIDRLVYCSVDFEDFLSKLQERGYQIKRGKYIAVKPEFAERFVRLKTLGNAYIPKNLEQRIADRDKFPNAVRAKYQTANTFEKQIHITVMNMIIGVKQFRLMPKKIDPTKIYVFQNDANINYLSEQLVTLRDFNLGSREEIYAKAEELQAAVRNKKQQGEVFSYEQEQLRRVNELIKVYEKIVEGNYIDNLIRAEKERTEALSRSNEPTKDNAQPKTTQTINCKWRR